MRFQCLSMWVIHKRGLFPRRVLKSYRLLTPCNFRNRVAKLKMKKGNAEQWCDDAFTWALIAAGYLPSFITRSNGAPVLCRPGGSAAKSCAESGMWRRRATTHHTDPVPLGVLAHTETVPFLSRFSLVVGRSNMEEGRDSRGNPPGDLP